MEFALRGKQKRVEAFACALDARLGHWYSASVVLIVMAVVLRIAAFVAMLGGSVLRLVLEFTLPKNFLLLLVGQYARSFGPGSYGGINVETGAPSDDWCPQFQLQDWTGLDSLLCPVVSLLLLLLAQAVLPKLEHAWFSPVPVDDKQQQQQPTLTTTTTDTKV